MGDDLRTPRPSTNPTRWLSRTSRQDGSRYVADCTVILGSGRPAPRTLPMAGVPVALAPRRLQPRLLAGLRLQAVGRAMEVIDDVEDLLVRHRRAEAVEDEPAAPVYSMNFVSPTELATSFERDLKFGGIFVPTINLPEEEEVVVEFLFDWSDEARVCIPAYVVKRFEAAEGTAMGEKVSGIGVAFSDPEGAIAEFLDIIESPELEQ